MKRYITLLTLIILGFSALSINANGSEKTSVDRGRYEIIQSKLARKHTFKLDKKTGNVYLMVKSSNDEIVWEKMPIEGLTYEDTSGDINFQIFLGDLMASDCFLINIHSGKVWQLYKDNKLDILFWSPVITK